MMDVRKEERRKVGFWGGFLSKVREFYWFLLFNCVLLVEKVYAQTGETKLVDFFCRIYNLMAMITYFIGPALGLIFVFMGIAKIRRKDDDPRAAGQGVWLIIAGVGCALSSIIFNALFGYFTSSINVNCGSVDASRYLRQ